MSNYRIAERAIGIASDEIEKAFDLYNDSICEMASRVFRGLVEPILKDYGLTLLSLHAWGWIVQKDGVTVDLDEEEWDAASMIKLFLDTEVPGFPNYSLAAFIDDGKEGE